MHTANTDNPMLLLSRACAHGCALFLAAAGLKNNSGCEGKQPVTEQILEILWK